MLSPRPSALSTSRCSLHFALSLSVVALSAPLSSTVSVDLRVSQAFAQADDSRALAQASRSKLLERQARHVNELWARLSELMRTYTEHRIQREKRARSGQADEGEGWVSWFLSEEGSRARELQELTTELLGHLRQSEAQRLKGQYFRLRDDIETARLESVRLAEDSHLAPSEGEAWFFQNSKADYAELVKLKKEAVKAMRQEQAQLMQDCHDHLVGLGVELSDAQVKQLFAMKSGAAIFDLIVTFAHLNLLLEVVTERIAPSSQGEVYATESERYYAIYVALIGLSLDIHRATKERLIKEDLKELDELGTYLKTLIRETRQHLQREVKAKREGSENIIASYHENLKTQLEIARDAKEYRGIITSQLKSLESVERELERQWDLAFNTYETARLSKSYYTIVNRGLRDLNNLRQLKMPNMIPLMSERLSDKLDRLEEYRQRANLSPKR